MGNSIDFEGVGWEGGLGGWGGGVLGSDLDDCVDDPEKGGD